MKEKIRNQIDNLFLELLKEARKDTEHKDENVIQSKCDEMYGYIHCASDMKFVSMNEVWYLLDAMHTVCHFL